jgi:hypothetical protein
VMDLIGIALCLIAIVGFRRQERGAVRHPRERRSQPW